MSYGLTEKYPTTDKNDSVGNDMIQLPENDEYYTHRSGRTARAGKEGVSICFVNKAEINKLRKYERTLGIRFEKVKLVY